MRQRDRESVTDSDPQGQLFEQPGFADYPDQPGPHDYAEGGSLLDDYDSVEADDGRVTRVARAPRRTDEGRRARHSQGRRRRNRRFVLILAALLVLVVAVSSWLIVLPIYHYLNPDDYSGAGKGAVIVTVQADDGAAQIGTTLHDHGVVASVRAFTDAASGNSKSKDIQPGSYRLHERMSAGKAVALLLNPSSRVKADVLVKEGATTLDIEARLTAPPCTAKSSASAICGPGLSKAAVQRAFKDVTSLGLPTDYTVSGKTPSSVEGFLFPATYYFPNKTDASAALQQMISKFTDQARATDFTARARALRITPYRELIIASIAQGEARFTGDFAKVARVILNRLAARRPLQIDATSVYGARLLGLDPKTVNNAGLGSPYNTYQHDGLPPTPIGNPGVDAMNGAAHPAAGNWLYYVNGDAAGHLFFTNSESAFVKAVAKCRTNHWGCA